MQDVDQLRLINVDRSIPIFQQNRTQIGSKSRIKIKIDQHEQTFLDLLFLFYWGGVVVFDGDFNLLDLSLLWKENEKKWTIRSL